MGTSREGVSDEVASDKLQHSQNPASTVHKLKSDQEELTHVVTSRDGTLNGVASDRLQQNQNPDTRIHEVESNKKVTTNTASSTNDVSDGIASNRPKLSQSPDTRIHEAQSNQEQITGMVSPRESVSVEVASNRSLQIQSPDSEAHEKQPSQESTLPSITPEKASEDGYSWRKYGQKLVKGNEFIRSYYKCTHPKCLVKKQLERSHEGLITDTLYFGKHDHSKPQSNPVPVGPVLPIQEERIDKPSKTDTEDKSSDSLGLTSQHIETIDTPKLSIITATDSDLEGVPPRSNRVKDEVDSNKDPEPKRKKLDTHLSDATQVDKLAGESRLVVQTRSEVDIVNDGYRWRKYGQKLVKGNSNPRSYYRCSSAGCPVKKHVERASHDPKMVITTYEGQHDHDMPPTRTVTHNTAGSNINTTAPNGKSRPKSERSDGVAIDVVVHYSLHPEGRPNEPPIPDAEPVQSLTPCN